MTKAVEGVSFPADLRTSLTDAPNPQGYPIAGTSYALVYEKQTDAAKAAGLVNFFSWVLTKGQDQVGAVNYAPLGSDLQKQSIAQLKKITLKGQPVAK